MISDPFAAQGNPIIHKSRMIILREYQPFRRRCFNNCIAVDEDQMPGSCGHTDEA